MGRNKHSGETLAILTRSVVVIDQQATMRASLQPTNIEEKIRNTFLDGKFKYTYDTRVLNKAVII